MCSRPGSTSPRPGPSSPHADAATTVGSPDDVLQRELIRALPSLRTLPEAAEAISAQLRTGRLTIRTARYAGPDREVVDEWINRVLVAATGAIGAVASALLLLGAAGTHDQGVREALWVLGFGGLTFSTTLLMRTAAQALHRLPLRDDEERTRRR